MSALRRVVAETVRGADGEVTVQPSPVPNDLPSVTALVHADLDKRDELGLVTYGGSLQPHNGRDGLLDAYEECLDLCQYLRQVLYERDGR